MDYSTWKYLNDNGYSPVEYIYKPDNFTNPNFGLGIIAYGNKYGLEVKMQASQEDIDKAMSGTQLQICGYSGLKRIDNLPYQNVCMVYIRQNKGYYLGRQYNCGWYTKPDGTITNNSNANILITPCDTNIHIVSTYYDSESNTVKTFLDGVQKGAYDSKSWENDLTAGTEYFVFGIGNSGLYAFKGRIYYIKTFDDERNVTGHFIPCVRKSDGRAGLYDVVNNIFKVSTLDYIKAGPEVIVIPWATGTGNIRLTYTGIGNGTIIAESDENNLYESRTQQISVETTKGGVIKRAFTTVQEAIQTDANDAIISRSKSLIVETTVGGKIKKSFTINQKVSPLAIKTVGCSNPGLLKADGTADESSSIVSQGYKYSDYIEIPEGVNGIYYENIFPNTGSNSGVCVYDSNKVFLIRGEYNNIGRRYSMGILNFSNYNNAKYIRFSKSLDNVTYHLRWLNIISDIRYSRNDASLAGLLKADGTVNTDSSIVSQGYKHSDYISIPAGTTHIEARVFPVSSSWSGLQIFNSNKTFLGNGESLSNGGWGIGQGVTVLSNFTDPKYIRFSPKAEDDDQHIHVRLINMTVY